MSNPIEEMHKRVAEDEKKDAEATAKAKKFNPKEALKKKLHYVMDDVLGEVCFGELTIGETFTVSKMPENDQERGLTILFYVLQKAYPDLTLDEVKQFPQTTAIRLLDIVAKHPSFLTSTTPTK